ncbi:MAG: hypothetical protein QM770_09570 [Tepidisphaeraceae bacterium]
MDELQSILADFASRAQRVGEVDGAQRWRFELNNHQYELRYWTDTTFNASVTSATRTFLNLQSLQKASIPARRVVANLRGFRLGDEKGDACILMAEDETRPLREVLRRAAVPLPLREGLGEGILQQPKTSESTNRSLVQPSPSKGEGFSRQSLLAQVAQRLIDLQKASLCPVPLDIDCFAPARIGRDRRRADAVGRLARVAGTIAGTGPFGAALHDAC